MSANGKRAVFTARGELFSVPLKDGITLDLTHTPGVHEREASWSHDGKRIAYVSDEGGEEAVWVRKADGGNATDVNGLTLVLHTLAIASFQRHRAQPVRSALVWLPLAVNMVVVLWFMRDDHWRNILVAGIQSVMAGMLLATRGILPAAV